MSWIVSTLTKPNTAWDTKEQADAEAIRLQPALSVVWFCAGVAQADVFAAVGDSEGGVALGPTETKRGPQIAAQGVAKAVERAMGHLGIRTGEIA